MFPLSRVYPRESCADICGAENRGFKMAFPMKKMENSLSAIYTRMGEKKKYL